jgi:hypothetical protein
VLAPASVVQSNRDTVARFIQTLAFVDNEGHPSRTDAQRHQVCENFPLRALVEELLVRLRITGTTDSQRNTGMLLQLSKALENDPDDVCTVYRMSPAVRRRRGIDDDGEVTNLFQGAAPVQPRERRGEVYPGDQAIRANDRVTIQIHMIDLAREEAGITRVIMNNVPVVAVWVPARVARGWLDQVQPGQPGRGE